ncbi:MAG: hypothetical protein MASP_01771 [Candidatus Methanolliviera sp. GoM_asphalt]|nr:MAG: hypothetical protein MASP_01771 [Candidatus Methanolliviera sp. GoM_asphalt]
MKQLDFAVQMITQYRTEKNADEVGIKRLHYWIISLPEEDENLNKEYKRLSHLLTNTPKEMIRKALQEMIENGEIESVKETAGGMDEIDRNTYFGVVD